MGVKHIHGSTTSLNGCKVDIDDDAHYSLTPTMYHRFSRVNASKWRTRES